MTLTQPLVTRLVDALHLETPIIALYDAPPSAEFEPLVRARGHACCFAYYNRWLRGETLVVERADDDFTHASHGCPGLARALGLRGSYPAWMANFLTDGKNGAPQGEGLKASPAIAQEFFDRVKTPQLSGDQILIGPLRLDQWLSVRTVTFFVDPDRLAALMTLAAYWSSDPDEVAAPFSSGCGLMWRELTSFHRDRAIIGCTDIAMRKHLPPDILSLTVSPSRFERMAGFPEEAFLNRKWWNELMKARGLSKG